MKYAQKGLVFTPHSQNKEGPVNVLSTMTIHFIAAIKAVVTIEKFVKKKK